MPFKDLEKRRLSGRKTQHRRYYRLREVIGAGEKKECACGCGKLINLTTPEGRIINFAKGHRILTPEESEHRRQIFKRISADPEYQRRRFLGQYIRPNKVERRLINIIERYKLPFKYVGDGYHIVEKSCPDFIGTDNPNLVIEVFGDYWHTLMGRTLMSTEDGRRMVFRKLGYEMLVLWESEMKHASDKALYLKILRWYDNKQHENIASTAA